MKLALIQMESTVGDIDNNVSTATRLIDDAADAGSKIILLPEYWSTGFFPASGEY